MPFLYRVDTGEQIGEIDERMLNQLTAVLEAEDADDDDFFVDAGTLDYLEGRGVDRAVLSLLRGVVSEQGTEIRWER